MHCCCHQNSFTRTRLAGKKYATALYFSPLPSTASRKKGGKAENFYSLPSHLLGAISLPSFLYIVWWWRCVWNCKWREREKRNRGAKKTFMPPYAESGSQLKIKSSSHGKCEAERRILAHLLYWVTPLYFGDGWHNWALKAQDHPWAHSEPV